MGKALNGNAGMTTPKTIREVLDNHRRETWQTGWNNDATEEALAQIQELIEGEVIGEDKPRPYRQTSEYGDAQNELREEQRAALKKLMGVENEKTR